MKMHSDVLDYIKYVKDNPSKINNARKELIENIVLPTIDLVESGDIYFDSDTYEKCVEFCEKRFYKLFPYQKFIYAFVFLYQSDKKEVPYFRQFFHLMGRGNGKDGMYAPLTCFLTTHYYGVPNYNIDIVANSEKQAEDTFKVVYEMLERSKRALLKFFRWNKVEIINKQTRSIFTFNTSNFKSKDGKRPGAIVFNEYHGYENYDQIKVFTSGLGKVKHPRIFIMTTHGYVRNGPLEEELDTCRSILKGEPNVLRIFPFICEIDYDEQADDKSKWVLANPSMEYMPTLSTEIQDHYHVGKSNPSIWIDFMTKRMNRPRDAEENQITSRENILKTSYKHDFDGWQNEKIPRSTPELINKNAIVGIDFASINDFATAGFLFLIDGEYIWRKRTWICKQSKFFENIKFPFERTGTEGFEDFIVVDEPYIREEIIVDWVVNESTAYSVVKIVMDSHRFPVLRRAFEDYGFSVETRDYRTGLIRMIRLPGSVYNIVIPQVEKELIKGSINFGNSAMMRWSVNNTYIKVTGQNQMYEKVEPKLRKNDAFMAFVHAFSAKDLLFEDEVVIYF